MTVPSARNLIRFTLEGAGIFLGADNGDLIDHSLYAAPERETRGGKCLAMIKTSRSRGHVRFTATADGLKPGSVELQSK